MKTDLRKIAQHRAVALKESLSIKFKAPAHV